MEGEEQQFGLLEDNIEDVCCGVERLEPAGQEMRREVNRRGSEKAMTKAKYNSRRLVMRRERERERIPCQLTK